MASEHEKAIIGAAIMGDTIAVRHVRPEMFHSPEAREVWNAYRSLKVESFHFVELVNALQTREAKALVDESQYLAAHGSVLKDCIEKLETEHVKRCAIDAISNAHREILSGSVWSAISDLAERFALMAAGDGGGDDISESVGAMLTKRMAHIARALESGERIDRSVPSGIRPLDEKIGGFPRGVVSVVAARPGMGKSLLGLVLAMNAKNRGEGAHVFSFEDSADSYCDRIIASACGVGIESLRDGNAMRSGFRQMQITVNEIMSNPWLVCSREAVSPGEIGMTIHRNAKSNNTTMVIVDYLNIIRYSGKRINRHEQLADIINELARVARDLNVAMIVMAQASRKADERSDKRPMLSDLKESGAIEERAKLVIGLHRPGYHEPGVDPTGIELIVMKNSNGSTGVIKAHVDLARMKIK